MNHFDLQSFLMGIVLGAAVIALITVYFSTVPPGPPEI